MLNVYSASSFRDSYARISNARAQRLASSADTTIKQALLKDGIAIARGLLSERDVSLLVQFQNAVESSMGTPTCGGYVTTSQPFVRHDSTMAVASAFNSEVRPNHGQVRLQTKGIPFEMPGFSEVSRHPEIASIFRWWSDDESIATRGTMEWIVPAELNHNGWHKDTVRPLVKAMIILGKIDELTAPMYYANGSHLCSEEFEAELSRRLSVNGTNKIDKDVARRGKHYPAIVGANAGYVGDDFTVNDPAVIDYLPITIGSKSYEKTVCVGDIGDVVFFEVSGFHSGNVSHGKVRRSITISSPKAKSDIGLTLDAMGVHSA